MEKLHRMSSEIDLLTCRMFIHNHKDPLGKFDEKDDDGFFLGYCIVSKAFMVFNIRRQEYEETFYVTFNEADEVIMHTNNEIMSFPGDEFCFTQKSNTQNSNKQYQRNKVWTLVLAPYGKTIIGTKWIFRNKMDENGTIIMNKARPLLWDMDKKKKLIMIELLHQLQDLK
ncbi:hypothetical protein Tco_1268679 [Tanacetum coccineum]